MSELKPGPFSWVFEDANVGQLIEAIRTAEEVVWDTETTGLNGTAVEGGPRNGGVGARQSLATFTLPQAGSDGMWDGVNPTTWIVPLSHPDSPFRGRWRELSREIMQAVIDFDKPLTGHHLKYDIRYHFGVTGMNLVKQFGWDTLDGERLLNQGMPADLGTAANRAFGIPTWKDFDFRTPGASEHIPIFELGEYGARDTYWTWRLKRYQQQRMFLTPGSDEPFDSEEVLDAKLGKLATWVAMPTVASLTQIEINGFALDTALTQKHYAESSRISQEGLEKVSQWYATDNDAGLVKLKPEEVSLAPTANWFRELTSYAVEKGELNIMELTPKGKPKWSKSILTKQARVRGEDSLASAILLQRHHSKRLEFLSAWLNSVSDEGLVHCSYNTGMATGRLSSSGPNMQQVTKSLRPCFVPRPGRVIADFDFSQIELRIAAFISRSAPMLQAFQEGKDLHRLLAAEVMSVDESEIGKDSDERQMAKAVNFGLLFGLGVYGLQAYAEEAYNVTMSQDQAQEFYHAYFRKWAGLKEWHAAVEARLLRDSRSVSPLGRVRNFRGGKNDLNAAINAPVQGMASDLMQIGIADIQGLLPAGQGRGRVEDIWVVGTVHDSAVIELPEDNWEAKALEVQERLENLNPLLKYVGIELDVPIKVEATVGTRWSLKDIGEVE